MKKNTARYAKKKRPIAVANMEIKKRLTPEDILNSDEPTATLDRALTAAERELCRLMPALDPLEISALFRKHIKTHLAIELNNIKVHGHRNDDPEDIPETTVNLSLSRREFDTVLAALRLWQHEASHIADGDGALADMASEHGEALTNEQIDGLCERLNCPPSTVAGDDAECDCAERSWYGAKHDSSCPLAGQPNPNSLL